MYAPAPSAPLKESGLVPYDGWCSKGGFWAMTLFIPPVALIAAIAALVGGQLFHELTWQYALACVGGSLVLGLLVLTVSYFCGECHFQIWAIQHPGHPVARFAMALLRPVQALKSCNNAWMHARRLKFGPNFCCAGQVVLGEREEVERALLAPQARGYYLGQTAFISSHCPGDDLGQRTTFLLAMSDEGAGGSGDRSQFKACMERYFFGSSDMAERRQDGISKFMLGQLAAEYTRDRSRFFNKQGPLEMFVIRYLTYVLFGIELEGEDLEVMKRWLCGNTGTVHYMWPFGYVLNKRSLIDQVAAIYERAPALQVFEEGVAAHAEMTKQELARAMTAVIRIAGKTGSFQLLETILGGKAMPNYDGETTGSIDVAEAWDRLDLDNRDEVKRFTLEVARLYPPVNVVHRVASEPFTCDFGGRAVSFPEGTLVMVPIVYGNLDKGFWGDTAYDLDHNRARLTEGFMGFNSVGDREAGRICPGRELVLEMCADVLAIVGRQRRAGASA